MKDIAGVKHAYVYPKRRGLGSLDVAITAVGSPADLAKSWTIGDCTNCIR